jgi:hypothetical protein
MKVFAQSRSKLRLPPVKRVAPFTMLLALLAGCSRNSAPNPLSSDATLRERIVGTWLLDSGSFKGTLSLASEGNFSAAYTNYGTSPVRAWIYDGKWDIVDGVCKSRVTKTQSWGTTNSQVVGIEESCKIVLLDDTRLTWEFGDQTINFERLK